jgi:transcription elongation factor SPT5
MLHQSFLSKSLKDPRYTYTRFSCSTAAKTIITLYSPISCSSPARDPNEPQWWVEQAFVVTAGICLVLDLFHRPEADPEAAEYLAHVQKAIHYLQNFLTSGVALHGVRLLMGLLGEWGKMQEGVRPAARRCDEAMALAHEEYVAAEANGQMMGNEDVTQPFSFDVDALDFEGLIDLPVEGGMESNMFLDTFFGFASGSFT